MASEYTLARLQNERTPDARQGNVRLMTRSTSVSRQQVIKSTRHQLVRLRARSVHMFRSATATIS
jgi:hypothetical protein